MSSARDRSEAVAFTRARFGTADPLQARELIDDIYGGQTRVLAGLRDGRRLAVEEAQSSVISLSKFDGPFDVAYRTSGEETGEYIIGTVLSGAIELEDDRGIMRFARGDVYVCVQPKIATRQRITDAAVCALRIPSWLLAEAAGGADRPAVRLGPLPHRLPPRHIKHWRQLTRYIESLAGDAHAGGSPLVLGAAARLAATTAQQIFSGGGYDETAADGRDATPETLRRAIAFIDANPDLDITVGDVARAASVTTRAVQLAFRRHLGTTPTRYLRQVRLDHAREQLRWATRDDGLTVTRVAIEWGFPNPSRFASYYHAAFGELPSATLEG